MRNITKYIAAAFLSTVMVAGSIPVQAMPVTANPAPAPTASDVIQVQHWDRYNGRRGWDGRRWDGPRWDGPRRPSRDYGWHNGHRGYRDYRPGYRRHNGYWFPLAAFATGAIIGGALSQPSRPAVRNGGVNPRHVSWCSNRYRSYRSYDNTFQPYNGPRQQCYSPYY